MRIIRVIIILKLPCSFLLSRRTIIYLPIALSSDTQITSDFLICYNVLWMHKAFPEGLSLTNPETLETCMKTKLILEYILNFF